MRHKLHHAGRLPLNEWGLFIRAWLMLLWVELGLRWFSYARVSRWFIPKNPKPSTSESDEQIHKIHRIWQLVDIASRNHVLNITCLRRSLVTQKLLAQQAIQVELRFGVKKEDGGIRAHAWLEYKGQTVGETETLSQAYEPLARMS